MKWKTRKVHNMEHICMQQDSNIMSH